jgi:hypothetical protein
LAALPVLFDIELGRIHPLVGESIRSRVLFTRHMGDGGGLKRVEEVSCLDRKIAQTVVLYLPFTLELVHDKLGIDEDGQVGDTFSSCQLQTRNKRAVLGDVVGRVTDSLGDLADDLAGLVGEHNPNAGGAGVTARTSVGVQNGFQRKRLLNDDEDSAAVVTAMYAPLRLDLFDLAGRQLGVAALAGSTAKSRSSYAALLIANLLVRR